MHQVSKPRSANQAITDEFGRPGTCRSKVGCEAIDEPCTNRMVPFFGPPGARFSHRNSLAGPLVVQCSWPRMEPWPLASFMTDSCVGMASWRGVSLPPRLGGHSASLNEMRGSSSCMTCRRLFQNEDFACKVKSLRLGTGAVRLLRLQVEGVRSCRAR